MQGNQSREVWKCGERVEWNFYGRGGNVVGTGVLQDNIKCGMELNAVKLCPFEVALQVVQVLDESMWIGEIVGEWLGQCVGFVIRWRRADI
jgi:hypothetical protein